MLLTYFEATSFTFQKGADSSTWIIILPNATSDLAHLWLNIPKCEFDAARRTGMIKYATDAYY